MPLIINKKEIHNISGPVSMYILKPKPNQPTFKGLPIYILFGDVHFGNENECDKKTSAGTTCNVYDIEFLSLLNKLSRKQEPIDFFVEGSDLHSQTQSTPLNGLYPLDKISKLYTECYSKRKLVSYNPESDCKQIPNIRWQSADPRQFSQQKYQKPLVTGCNYSSITSTIISDIKSKKPITPFEFKNTIDGSINYLISKYGRPCISKLTEENPFSVFYTLKLKNEILETIITKQIRTFSTKVYKKIYKQLLNYMDKYIDFNFYKYKNVQADLALTHISIMNIIKNILNPGSTTSFVDLSYTTLYNGGINMFNTYFNNIVNKELLILDLYVFFRSLKYSKRPLPSQTNPVPILNICYLGNSHVENMVHLLTNITDMYDIEYSHPLKLDKNGFSIRCLQIKNKINLDDIIRDLSEDRLIDGMKQFDMSYE